MAGTQRRKSYPAALGLSRRMLHLVKKDEMILGQARLFLLLKARNKKVIPGQAKYLLLQQWKKLTPGAMEMEGVGTLLVPLLGIRNLLGANQAPQVEIKSQLGRSQIMVMIRLDSVGVDLELGIEAEGEEGLGTRHGMEEVT